MPGPLDWLIPPKQEKVPTKTSTGSNCLSSNSPSPSPTKGSHRKHCSPQKKFINYVTRPRPPLI